MDRGHALALKFIDEGYRLSGFGNTDRRKARQEIYDTFIDHDNPALKEVLDVYLEGGMVAVRKRLIYSC